MSGWEIKDGGGSQRSALVDEDNRLMTRAIILSEFGHHSLQDGHGYGVYLRHTFVAADTNEELAYLVHNGATNVKIIIKQLTVVSNGTSLKMEMFFDPGTPSSAGDNSEPLNLNRGSSNQSELTAAHDNGSALAFTTAAANEFLDLRIGTGQPSFTYDFRDALVLTPNASLGFIGEAGDIGDKCRLNVYYYEIHE